MNYIQGMAEQTEIFFYSLGFGFLLGILYDVFRTLRLTLSRSAWVTFFADTLYFILCGFLIFFFMLVTDKGRLRLYAAAGEILGWIIYYFSLGTVALRLSNTVIAFFRRILFCVSGFFRRLFGKVMQKNKKFMKKCKKIIRKTDKKTKFNLQKHRHIVYNLYGYMKNHKFSEKEKKNGCKKGEN